MKTWLTIWKQAFLEHPSFRYIVLVWLVGTTALTAFHWPASTHESLPLFVLTVQVPGMFLATLGLIVWGSFIVSVDAQLSPRAVQLVPRLRPSVAGATVVGWLVVSAVLALQTSLHAVPLAWVGAAILVSLALVASRAIMMRWFGVLFSIVPIMAPLYGRRAPPSVEHAPAWAGWTAVAIAIVVGAAWIVAQLGGPAEGRVASYARAQTRRRRTSREPSAESAWGLFARRPRAQEWLSERVLRIPTPEARALHGLGPAFHWSQAAIGAPVQGAIVYATFYVFYKFILFPLLGVQDMKIESVFRLGPIGFIFAVQLAGIHLRELHLRHKEQALLLLLPGAPNRSAVNGMLMRMLLAQHFLAIVTGVAFVVALTVALDQTPRFALRTSAAPLSIAVLATPLLLRDYARMRRPGHLQWLLFTMSLLLPLELALQLRGVVEPVAMVLMAVGLSTIVSAVRYMQVLDAWPAFPVGRLAQ